jgi:hypothetical protein
MLKSIAFFVYIVLIFQSFASDHADYSWLQDEQLKKWVPAKFHDHASLEKIKDQNEPCSLLLPLKPLAGAVQQDHGSCYNFLTPLEQMMLEEIRAQNTANRGQRPLIADLGAGMGYMSWKMIVAGGQCYAVELDRERAKQACTNSLKAREFLDEGETLKSCFKGFNQDVLTFGRKSEYEDFFALTYSGNILHFFTPAQAQQYVKMLFNITQEEGLAFARVHVPNTPETLEQFNKAKKANKPFPGYMLMNLLTIQIDSNEMNYSFNNVLGYPKRKLDPALIYPGHYEPSQRQAPKYSRIPLRELSIEGQKVPALVQHRTVHYFDKETLSSVFRNVGFKVEECFYIDNQTCITESFDKAASVCIKARKIVNPKP